MINWETLRKFLKMDEEEIEARMGLYWFYYSL